MKLKQHRPKKGAWTFSLIPETKREARQLKEMADLSPNRCESDWNANEPFNIGITLSHRFEVVHEMNFTKHSRHAPHRVRAWKAKRKRELLQSYKRWLTGHESFNGRSPAISKAEADKRLKANFKLYGIAP